MEELKSFVFKKKFGQNFILDNNFLTALVDGFELNPNDEVLEIGTGAGTLTKNVASRVKKVCTYEIDKDLCEILEKQFDGIDNIEITFNDILKVPTSDIEDKFGSSFKLVANIPYYITSPIIFKFLKSLKVTHMFLMVQKEVGERFAATVGDSEYGIPSVLVASVGKASLIKNVNRKMFHPAPNVDSCILKIEIKRDKFDLKDWDDFANFVQNAFAMRRKTLVNNLSSKLPVSKEEIKKQLQSLGLDENVRPENLSVEQFVELYKKF